MMQMTFLMDSDPTTGPQAANKFYTIAAKYFNQLGAPAYPWPAGQHSLEEVFAVLRATSPAPDVINIVCHATGFGTMGFALTKAALKATPKRDWTQLSDLSDALDPVKPTMAPLAVPAITGNASVVLYGCDVGRSIQFVKLLGNLFGNPAKIVAPCRVATFKTASNGDAQYRLSRTWSVPSRLLPAMPPSPASALWPGFRTQFVQQASLIFGSKANQVRPLGSDDLQQDLQSFVPKATDSSMDPSFFVEGYLGLSSTQLAALAPATNADPAPQGIPLTPQEVDDSWQATTLTKTDGVQQPGSTTKWDVTVTVLTTVIDTDVNFAEPRSFFTWYCAPPNAPGKPPPVVPANPPLGGGGPPEPSGDLGSLTDQLLAAGLSQTDLAPLLAALVPPAVDDDTSGSADPDVPPADDPDDDNIDQLLPVEDV